MNKYKKQLLINSLLGLLILVVLIKILYYDKINEGFQEEYTNDVIVEEEETNNNPTLLNGKNPYHNDEGADVKIIPGKNVNVKAKKFNGVLNVYTPHIKK